MPDPTTPATEQSAVVPPNPDRRYMSYAEFNGRSRRAPQPPRFAALSDYRQALEALTNHLEKFPIYDDEAILPLWGAKNTRRHTELIDALGRFHECIRIHTDPDPNEPANSVRDELRAADAGAALVRAWLTGITADSESIDASASEPSAAAQSGSDSQPSYLLGPCTAAESRRFAHILRALLTALDREIVVAALVGDRESDLLDSEREEIHRVREFLDRWIVVRSEPSDLRSRALAVLNSVADSVEAGAAHSSSPSVDGTSSRAVGDGSVAGVEEAPATESNNEEGERDAAIAIARETALLEDAVSRRDAVFVRIRELSVQPPSEWLCGHLAVLGSELNQHTLQVQRRTVQLEGARAAASPKTGCEQHPGEACGRVPTSQTLGRTTRRRRY